MILRTEGIVIERREWSEASQLLTLFTATHGRLHAIAKGARRPKSRHGGGVDLLDRVQALFYPRPGGLNLLAETSVLPGFRGLRARLDRLLAGLGVAEALRDGTRDEEPAPEVYALAAETLGRLGESDRPGVELAAFESRFLAAVGLAPRLDACASCGGEAPEGEPVGFSADSGGVVCRACAAESGAALRTLRPAARALLRSLAAGTPAARVRPDAASLRQARAALTDLLRTLGERPSRPGDRFARWIEQSPARG
ncbi:MAG: DNA repair protein RecO [Planctomycetales bacterium]|nr:DNA repair protein RecO [Planctomycetales bacterium]